MSTPWTRERSAKLSEDRKETAGLIAAGSCGYLKLSKIGTGVKNLCRQQDCAEVTTKHGCSRVGNPRVQSLSQFLRKKSRTSRKGKLLHARGLAPSLQQPALATRRTVTAHKWVDSGHILPSRLRFPQKAQMEQLS